MEGRATWDNIAHCSGPHPPGRHCTSYYPLASHRSLCPLSPPNKCCLVGCSKRHGYSMIRDATLLPAGPHHLTSLTSMTSLLYHFLSVCTSIPHCPHCRLIPFSPSQLPLLTSFSLLLIILPPQFTAFLLFLPSSTPLSGAVGPAKRLHQGLFLTLARRPPSSLHLLFLRVFQCGDVFCVVW